MSLAEVTALATHTLGVRSSRSTHSSRWTLREGARIFRACHNLACAIGSILNMYTPFFWRCRSWRSSWNIFDFNVVSIGIIMSRGDCIGNAYFGSSLKSLYTFFQVYSTKRSSNISGLATTLHLQSSSCSMLWMLNVIILLNIVILLYDRDAQ